MQNNYLSGNIDSRTSLHSETNLNRSAVDFYCITNKELQNSFSQFDKLEKHPKQAQDEEYLMNIQSQDYFLNKSGFC